jgi:hypothetical protein
VQPDRFLEAFKNEGLFGHPGCRPLHGTEVVVWVGMEGNEGGHHEYTADTDCDDGAAELAALVASHLVRPTMMQLFPQTGGAFEPWWWIPTAGKKRVEVQTPASPGNDRQCTNGPRGTSLAPFPGKQGHAGAQTPFTIQQGGHHGRVHLGIFHA